MVSEVLKMFAGGDGKDCAHNASRESAEEVDNPKPEPSPITVTVEEDGGEILEIPGEVAIVRDLREGTEKEGDEDQPPANPETSKPETSKPEKSEEPAKPDISDDEKPEEPAESEQGQEDQPKKPAPEKPAPELTLWAAVKRFGRKIANPSQIEEVTPQEAVVCIVIGAGLVFSAVYFIRHGIYRLFVF